ncbi:MAG: CHAT domain-containing protein [Oscillatoria sp. PMC 1051.18]|nr:CHAT domain-containing protein [Oscillatoria sp. PMC 1050.18]MEC5031924.1 CHAT domain-containing protein [Oscillatoria sp. PMC 1051.18]
MTQQDVATRGIVIKTSPKTTTAANSNSQYLGDRFRLRIVPSCQVLNYCHERDPLTTKPDIGIVEDATEDLPFTSYECEKIAEIYQVSPEKRLRGKAAAISAYKKLLRQVHVLHTSHHASSNLNNPLASVLQLADGSLTLGELVTPGWRLPNLHEVFISCCETNFTVTEISDNFLSIAVGFLCAGARSVVSTQWSVEDLASAMLAILYYERRDQNLSRSAALQQAQKTLRGLTGAQIRVMYFEDLDRYFQERYGKDTEAYAKAFHRLESCCQNNSPFAHPYWWAGFLSQGLA